MSSKKASPRGPSDLTLPKLPSGLNLNFEKKEGELRVSLLNEDGTTTLVKSDTFAVGQKFVLDILYKFYFQ